ncbi:precorrin-2 dehydrogenase/sirohydrochlorin ferrochelatase family protein [Cohnella yongneupensis]|uniref:precorrin-2 dehydrogenase n=1 Tax=Cohnella yongneupensis TaxID=425006 RepID=A0ABW0QZ02_9BACL
MSEHEWYPILLSLKDRTCVVIGGGEVAERKARGLLNAGASVRVISPSVTRGLSDMAQAGSIHLLQREYAKGDLEGATLAFAATDRQEVNASVAAEARERGIPVNVADGDTEGDFIVPAVLRRGDLVLSASASGAGPAVSARIIGELSSRYGPEYEGYLKALRQIRAIVRAEVPDPGQRRRLLAAASTEEALIEWSRSDFALDKRALLDRLEERALDGKG